MSTSKSETSHRNPLGDDPHPETEFSLDFDPYNLGASTAQVIVYGPTRRYQLPELQSPADLPDIKIPKRTGVVIGYNDRTGELTAVSQRESPINPENLRTIPKNEFRNPDGLGFQGSSITTRFKERTAKTHWPSSNSKADPEFKLPKKIYQTGKLG